MKMIMLFKILKIWNWHKKTFPDFTEEMQERKVRSEINELQEIFDKYIRASLGKRKYYRAELNDELADVIIASLNLLRYKKYRDLVDNKMMINKVRKFDENGHHIENKPKALQ